MSSSSRRSPTSGARARAQPSCWQLLRGVWEAGGRAPTAPQIHRHCPPLVPAAARSVGIPARIAGCSQSIPNDDHHWVEYYDASAPGPFGSPWHTKEGTSAGELCQSVSLPVNEFSESRVSQQPCRGVPSRSKQTHPPSPPSPQATAVGLGTRPPPPCSCALPGPYPGTP